MALFSPALPFPPNAISLPWRQSYSLRGPVEFASLVLKWDKSLHNLPFHRAFSEAPRSMQRKRGLVPLTLVLIGDRSPSILAKSSRQFLSSASYSVCVPSLSIPHEKSHARSRQWLPSPRCRCCTPSSLTWIPGAREALRAEKSAPLLALFPLSVFFLVLSPPSLSSLSLSIISLQLSVYHAHLTNDLCLRYRIWAKKSGLNKLQGSSPKSEEANAT